MGRVGKIVYREYVDFDPDGKVVKMVEATYHVESAPTAFTLDVRADEVSYEELQKMVDEKAEEIDKAAE